MKRNIFLIVFVFFATTVFYKFGPKPPTPTPSKSNLDKVKKATTPIPAKVQGTPSAPPTPVASPPAQQVVEKESTSILPQLQKVDTSTLSGAVKDYSELKNQVLDSIPSKDELKEEAKKNPHMPSSKLIQAGKELGQLKSFILRYPDNSAVQKEAEAFYEQCATYTSYPNSIRSLCLYNRTILSKNKGEKFDTSAYPDEVKKVILKQGM